MKKQKTQAQAVELKPVMVYFPAELKKQLKILAAQQEVTLVQLINMVLQEYVNKHMAETQN